MSYDKILESLLLEKKEAKKYWENIFNIMPSKTNIIRDVICNSKNIKIETKAHSLENELSKRIKEVSGNDNLAVYTILLAVFEMAIRNYCLKSEVTIGIPVYYKDGNHGKSENSLIFSYNAEDEITFKEFLLRTKDKLISTYKNQIIPLKDIISESELTDLNAVSFSMSGMHQDSDIDIFLKSSCLEFAVICEMNSDGINLNVYYDSNKFSDFLVRQIISTYEILLKQSLFMPNKKISEFSLISDEEKRIIMEEFNATDSDFGKEKTVVQLYDEVVLKNPSKTAISFNGDEITYLELNERANKLAHFLAEKGVGPGVVAGVLLERSFELIITLLAILKAGGAYLPIEKDWPDDRIQYIIDNSNTKLLVTQGDIIINKEIPAEKILLECIDLKPYSKENLTLKYNLSDLLYIIYTSGTTGKPKGVMFLNRAMANLVSFQKFNTSIHLSGKVLQFATIAFDVASQEIWSTLLSGGTLELIESEKRKDISSLLEHIRQHEISTVFLPTAFFKLIASERKYLKKLVDTVDHIIVAGEQLILESDVVDYLNSHNTKLHNHYGPTETHVVTTITLDGDNNNIFSIGKPISNTQIYILDKNKKLIPPGMPGELYISGNCLSNGYINNESLTQEKFVDNPFLPNKKMYKTGDLGKWLPNGDIHFLGRIDDQVKIRGFRVEIGEVENALLSIQEVKNAVVLSLVQDQENYLCAYYSSDFDSEVLIKDKLKQILPDYMIPYYFVKMDDIPYTINGKVDRRALAPPSLSLNANISYEKPSNELEEKLQSIWEDVLRVNSVGVNDDFFEIGGQSLKAIILIGRIQRELGFEISVQDVFEHYTIRKMSEFLNSINSKNLREIKKSEEREYYPVSSAQRRMFILQNFNNNETIYNIPQVVKVTGAFDVKKAEKALFEIISLQESLRTNFDTVDNEIVQKIKPISEVSFNIEIIDMLEEDSVADVMDRFVRPFDLKNDLPFRVGLVKLSSDNSLMLIDMHHIVCDGISLNIFMKMFVEIYSGEKSEGLEIQYKDFVIWQNEEKNEQSFVEQKKYWVEKFSGELPKADLPFDYPLNTQPDFLGDAVNLKLSGKTLESLLKLAQKFNCTLYTLLLSCFSILISRYTGQNDIVVGSPIAGRKRPELENIIGMFVNTLAMRNKISQDDSFINFMEEVRDNTIDAFQNQDYPFEELVEELGIERQLNRNPIFNIMFTLQNMETAELCVQELIFEEEPWTVPVEKMDLTVNVREIGNELDILFSYAKSLFNRKTIENMVAHFNNILDSILSDPYQKIRNIEMMSEEEKFELIHLLNANKTEYPRNEGVVSLFEKQVILTPDNIAVSDGFQNLTYRELNKKANQVADLLREYGIEPEKPIGIMTGHDCQMTIGTLGILKAGGAYVPIDPEYPLAHKEYLISEASADFVLIEDKTCNSELPQYIKTINIDDPSLEERSDENSLITSGPDSLCYIMYTSGSTGKAKGVAVINRNVVRLVRNTNYVTFNTDDRILQTGAISFDATTFELWGSLLNGLTLYLCDIELLLNAESFEAQLKNNKITILFLTTQLFNQLADQKPSVFCELRYLYVGGEKLSPAHINKVFEACPGVCINNIYGPTENTTFSIYHCITHKYFNDIPIGIPISNSTAYVLDNEQRLVPKGVYGELYVGGDGVAREYINHPELTKEKYISNPFIKDERIYRTGDMARINQDGLIEFAGRVDHMIKIRGFRIELIEVEKHLQEVEEIIDCVVTAVHPKQNEKALCGYFVSDRKVDISDLRQKLSAVMPSYMLPQYMIQLDKLPINRNGKIDRKALPKPEDTVLSERKYVEPENSAEKILQSIFSDVLGIKQVSVLDNFFDLGGHSLNATIIVSRISREFNQKVKVRDIFAQQNIRNLADYILRNAETVLYTPISKVKQSEYYSTSSAQKRMFILQEFDKNSTAYNIPYAFEINGYLDPLKLEDAFEQLIKRHDILRTVYSIKSDNVLQHVLDPEQIKFKIDVLLGREEELSEIIQKFIRPFDLKQEPPIRVSFVMLSAQRWIILIDMHHIASDGGTMNILISELGKLYKGEELTPLEIQYSDYAAWHNQKIASNENQKQEEYWLSRFSDSIPVLELPTDFSRPAERNFEGSYEKLTIEGALADSIREASQGSGVSLFMYFMSALNILLYKYTDQDDIVIGTPIAGRTHPDLENLMGMFVNTLAIRNRITENDAFNNVLEKVKNNTLQAFNNQDYAFEDLVEKLKIERRTDRNALFDIMFVMQNNKQEIFNVDGIEINNYYTHHAVEKFDMTIEAYEDGKDIIMTFGYAASLFKPETIKRMKKHFVNILEQITCNSNVSILEIALITPEEKECIRLYNDTAMPLPADKTLKMLIERQACLTPERIAVKCGSEAVTYRELNERANYIANQLIQYNIGSGSVVGIKIDRSVTLVTAIIAVLKTGAAYVPMEVDLPEKRIESIVETAEIELLLTDGNNSGYSYGCRTLNILEDIGAGLDKQNPADVNSPDDVAYIIFTSGSTGYPKGVVITHKACVNTILDINQRFQVNSDDVILMISSISFDLSVYDIFGALSSGAKVVITKNSKNLEELKQSLDEITIWNSVPAFIDILTNYLDADYSNSTLRHVLLSGDWIPLGLPEKIKGLFKNANVTSLGGATEGSIWSIHYPINEIRKEWKSIPYGYPLANQKMYILDNSLNQQPIGIPGEICIGGAGVALGYANNSEKTGQSFVQHPELGWLYRTGDKGVFTQEGYIEFKGRLDFQVKLRGYRIELEEIQNNILTYPKILDCVVVMKERKEDGQFLCAYYVGECQYTVHEFREHLLKTLPVYMIPAYFMKLDKLPLTANGKIDRKNLPEPEGEINTGINFVPPENLIEEKLIQIWEKVLKTGQIGRYHNFFELGGNSLSATYMLSEITNEWSIKISLKDIFSNPTVQELADYISDNGFSEEKEILTKQKKNEYPVSSQQKRMFLFHKFQPDSLAYNMPMLLEAEDELDEEKLSQALKKLIMRHDSLRTGFYMKGEDITQKIHDSNDLDFKIEKTSVSDVNDAMIKANELVKAFSLEKPPLMRVHIIESLTKQYLFIDMHHIISDGVSMSIFAQELAALYGGADLQPLEYQYCDYSEWAIENSRNSDYLKQRDYWINELDGELPVLNLPIDFMRPYIKRYEGDAVDLELPLNILEGLKEIAKNTNTTLYMVLQTVYMLLLSKLSGQDEIMSGSPIAGRNRQDIMKIIGVFINTIVIRSKFDGDNTFIRQLELIKEKSIGAFENQEYQFDDLIEELGIEKDPSRNQIIDTMFIMQNIDLDGVYNNSLNIKPVSYNNSIERFDLTLTATETRNGIKLTFNYDVSLFKEETVKTFAQNMMQLIKNILEQPDKKISELDIIDEEEKMRILNDFNNTRLEYDRKQSIIDRIHISMQNSPEKEAIVFGGQRLTYRQLKEKMKSTVEQLKNAGVCEDTLVVVSMRRSIEMVIALLSVLEAGGAYLPIDPGYPQERKSYMIEDSGAGYILTDDDNGGIKLNTANVNNVRSMQNNQISPEKSLAYVIYTSGSTGKPKGVRIENGSVVNFWAAINQALEFNKYNSVLCITTISFDIFVLEALLPLMNGMKMVLVPDGDELDGNKLAVLMQNEEVEIVQTTPSRWNALLENQLFKKAASDLSLILTGGEPLSKQLSDQILQMKKPRLFNMYGPTETTVWSAVKEIRDTNKILIGKPIANTKMYILDESGKVKPCNLDGELYIGGEGLARDYYNRPDLTNERFIQNPFCAQERIYKTGDKAKWTIDGEIEFLGRTDNQIKFRGYRIELEEIDKTLLSIEGVSKAKTILKENNNNQFICSFLEWNGEEKNSREIKDLLRKYLPEYMVPAFYVKFDKIPLMGNGKTDVTKLQEYEIDLTHKITLPQNETEEFLLGELTDVLKIDGLGTTDNLLEFGANSLNLMRFMQRIQNRYEIEYQEIVMNPYISEIAKLVKPRNIKDISSVLNMNDESESEEMQERYKIINKEKEKYLKTVEIRLQNNYLNFEQEFKDILLTGATGFLGIHLLYELLNYSQCKIYVLIRGDSKQDAIKRLKDLYNFYFDKNISDYIDRINFYNGDFTKNQLGLDYETYTYLAEHCDCILNTAADVRHFGLAEEFDRTNVQSVKDLIDLCNTGISKHLMHVSTISIGHCDIKNVPAKLYTEFDVDVGQHCQNPYLYSKLRAETLIEEGRKNGLKATIFRVGNLVFQSKTGKCQKNIESNGFYNRLRALINTAIIPNSESKELEFTFVDEAAKAIRYLMGCKYSDSANYHIFNPYNISYFDFASMLQNNGYNMELLEMQEYIRVISGNSDKLYEKEILDTIMAKHNSKQTTYTVTSTEFTEKILSECNFFWNPVSSDQIFMMVEYGVKIGIFDIKRSDIYDDKHITENIKPASSFFKK